MKKQFSHQWMRKQVDKLQHVKARQDLDEEAVRLRKKHPALQEAYDKYLVLLNLYKEK